MKELLLFLMSRPETMVGAMYSLWVVLVMKIYLSFPFHYHQFVFVNQHIFSFFLVSFAISGVINNLEYSVGLLGIS
jgi:hypothetical protein